MVSALANWSSHEFGIWRRKVDSLVIKLGCLKQNYGHFDNAFKIQEFENKIDRLLYNEETYWKQR